MGYVSSPPFLASRSSICRRRSSFASADRDGGSGFGGGTGRGLGFGAGGGGGGGAVSLASSASIFSRRCAGVEAEAIPRRRSEIRSSVVMLLEYHKWNYVLTCQLLDFIKRLFICGEVFNNIHVAENFECLVVVRFHYFAFRTLFIHPSAGLVFS